MQPERKKILMFGYLPPPFFGPSVTYQALMQSQFSRQHDVTFIDLTLVQQLDELEVFQLAKLWRSLRFFGKELWYLLTRRFDFACAPVSVNRNAFLKDAAVLWLARLFRVPTVLYAHGNNLPDFRSRSPWWVQWTLDCTFRRAAAAVVLGERLRFNFDAWLPAHRVFVVPTGIEPAGPTLRESRGTGCTVLYLGNMVREKGFFVLLAAAARIAGRRRDLRFVFGGAWRSAADEREAREYVTANGLTGQVEFAGPVVGEAKARLLAGADLLVFPTFYYYETMGLVLLEAMQAGLPIVTTRRASIPEIIADGVNGLLVNEQDALDLAEKILQLVEKPEQRAAMGNANRERFAEYYTHEHYGARMGAVFEELARSGPP
jgi:glycosyltransferase involved in cell wall biosynthesis